MSKKRKPAATVPLTDDPNALKPDDDIPEADFEDRVLLYWERNRKNIMISLVMGATALVLYHLLFLFMDRREKSIGEAFNKCEDASAFVAFADEYSGHQLASAAFLKAANLSFEKGQYTESANYFEKALGQFTDDVLMSGRARLGMAMSKIGQNALEDGVQMLETIASSETEMDTTRAEASYAIAVLAWEKEDYQTIRDQITLISGLEQPGYWIRRISGIEEKIPQAEVETE